METWDIETILPWSNSDLASPIDGVNINKLLVLNEGSHLLGGIYILHLKQLGQSCWMASLQVVGELGIYDAREIQRMQCNARGPRGEAASRCH